MVTLESFLATSITDQVSVAENLVNINAEITDLTGTRTEVLNRIMTPSEAVVDTFITAKFTELQTVGGYDEFRITKGSEYNVIPAIPVSLSTPGAYPTSNLSDWMVEAKHTVDDEWTNLYDYTNAVTDVITSVINANEEFVYAYDLLAQKPINLDGTYGINERIANFNRVLTIFQADEDKLEDTEVIVQRVLDTEGS
jgi:hypothetical protein